MILHHQNLFKNYYDDIVVEIKCRKCDQTLEIGDTISTKRWRGKTLKKHYHKKCYEGLLL